MLLAGIAGLLLVLTRWFPETFTYPQLAIIHDSGAVTIALRLFLPAGYASALISLMLRAFA